MRKTPEQIVARSLGVPPEITEEYLVPFKYMPEAKVRETLHSDPKDGKTALMHIEVNFPGAFTPDGVDFFLNALHKAAYGSTYDAQHVVYPVVTIEDLTRDL